MSDRCVHRRFPLSQSPATWSATPSSAATTASPTAPTASASPCPARPGSRAPRGCTAYPVVEQDSLRLGVHRRPGPRRRRARSRARRGSTGRAGRPCRGMEPLAARAEPARRQPDGPLARDLPARRLHRHAGGGRDADHHRGRRRGRRSSTSAGTWPTPSARRSTRSRTGIEGRITRWQDIEYHPAVPLPAAQPDRAGRRRCPNDDGTDPDAFHVEVVYAITPETETQHPRLLGGGPRLRPRRRGGVGLPAPRATAPSSCRTSSRSNVLEQVIAGEPDGYQELSINIDTGGLAARRILDRMAAERRAGAAARERPVAMRAATVVPGRLAARLGPAASGACHCGAETEAEDPVGCGSGCSRTRTIRPADRRPRRRRELPPPTGARRHRSARSIRRRPDASERPCTAARRGGPRLRVARRTTGAEGVVVLTCATRRRRLPAWAPGAHVDLRAAPAAWSGSTRCAATRPTGRVWRIAVLREPDGRGGSRVRARRARRGRPASSVRGPRNHFPLVAGAALPVHRRRHRHHPDPADDRRGRRAPARTGSCSTAAAAAARWRSWTTLDAATGDRVTLHPQDEVGLIDLDALLGAAGAGHAGLLLRPGAAAASPSSSAARLAGRRAARRAVRAQGRRRAGADRRRSRSSWRSAG